MPSSALNCGQGILRSDIPYIARNMYDLSELSYSIIIDF